MKKQTSEKYDQNKYLRAYLVVMLEKLSRLEAKIDMIQYDICGDGGAAGLKFLDPKRKRLEGLMEKKHSGDTNDELAGLIGLLEDREKKSKKRS